MLSKLDILVNLLRKGIKPDPSLIGRYGQPQYTDKSSGNVFGRSTEQPTYQQQLTKQPVNAAILNAVTGYGADIIESPVQTLAIDPAVAAVKTPAKTLQAFGDLTSARLQGVTGRPNQQKLESGLTNLAEAAGGAAEVVGVGLPLAKAVAKPLRASLDNLLSKDPNRLQPKPVTSISDEIAEQVGTADEVTPVVDDAVTLRESDDLLKEQFQELDLNAKAARRNYRERSSTATPQQIKELENISNIAIKKRDDFRLSPQYKDMRARNKQKLTKDIQESQQDKLNLINKRDKLLSGYSEDFQQYVKSIDKYDNIVDARPNFDVGDLQGILPNNAQLVKTNNNYKFYRDKDGSFYATDENNNVLGYALNKTTNSGSYIDLQVGNSAQKQGLGSELQFLIRSENPYAQSGGLTSDGIKSLQKTYNRMINEGVIQPQELMPTSAVDDAVDAAEELMPPSRIVDDAATTTPFANETTKSMRETYGYLQKQSGMKPKEFKEFLENAKTDPNSAEMLFNINNQFIVTARGLGNIPETSAVIANAVKQQTSIKENALVRALILHLAILTQRFKQ